VARKNVLEPDTEGQPVQQKTLKSSSGAVPQLKPAEDDDSRLNGASPSCKANARRSGWQEIEARRERAALKKMLAEIWDDDFELDEGILGETDEDARFYRAVGQLDEEPIDETGEIDEFYDGEDD
jgi:hypothetical protein